MVFVLRALDWLYILKPSSWLTCEIWSSPFSAGAALLPLTPENNYTPEVLICGGSTVSDTASPSTYSSQTPASAQCSRIVLTAAGIAAGWSVETMPMARVMGELVQLPDGRILIVNGAQTGVAGYGNVGTSCRSLFILIQMQINTTRSKTKSAKAMQITLRSRQSFTILPLLLEVVSLPLESRHLLLPDCIILRPP